MPLARATLSDVSTAPTANPTTVTVQFNPTDYTIDHGVRYAEMPVNGLSMPILQFLRGEADFLNLELFLDGTDARGNVHGQLKDLRKFIQIDSKLHAPPVCRFAWGPSSLNSFVGVVVSLREKFTLFNEDGSIARARVNVTFKSYKSAEVQRRELSLSSPDRTHIRVLRQGETLAHIAQEAYGDARAWRPIAEANGITRPRFVAPGTPLKVPAL
jgi:hypothetical protein